MKTEELKQRLGISQKVIDKHCDFNPLSMAISEEFNDNTKKGDYRELALDRCIEARVSFVSETNSLYNLVERCVKIINPINNNEMEPGNASGNGYELTITYKDPLTGDTMHVTFQNDAFGFQPKKK